MSGHLRALPWATLLWLFLQLSAFTAANEDSGSAERAYLWDRYEAFCEIEGADKQKYLLPQSEKGSPHDWYDNKGSGPNQMYTYAEFQARIEGKLHVEVNFEKFKDLKAPFSDPGGLTPTLEDCHKKLKAATDLKSVKVEFIDPKLTTAAFKPPKNPGKGKGVNFYDPTDPHNSPYAYLIDRTEEHFQALRIKHENHPKFHAKLELHNKRGAEILKHITILRDESSKTHMYKQLTDTRTDTPKNMGLSLNKPGQITVHVFHKDPETKVVEAVSTDRTNTVKQNLHMRSAISWGPEWIQVQVATTMTNAWKDPETQKALRAQGFTSVKSLKRWAEHLGNPDKSVPKLFSEDNYKHFRVYKALSGAHKATKMSLAELKSCPR